MVDYELNSKGVSNLANMVIEFSIREQQLMKADAAITNLWLSLAGTTYEYYYQEYMRRINNPQFNFNEVSYEFRPMVKDYIETDLTISELTKKYKTSVQQLYRVLERYHIPHRKHGGGSCKL